MARFIGYVEGGRGEASRLGTPKSGIRAQAQGWDVGVTVLGGTRPENREQDEFTIWATPGSSGGGHRVLVGVVRLDDDGQPAFYPADAIVRELVSS